MKIETALEKIVQLTTASLSAEQKLLAENILKKAPEGAISEWLKFIIKPIETDFVLDPVSKLSSHKIALIKENKSLGVNLDDHVSHCLQAQSLESKKLKRENKLIIGENYDALKNLLLTHREKIDVIYIDPSYNIEIMGGTRTNLLSKQNINFDNFCYRNKFSETGWLNFMKKRLILAEKLLTDDGVIFVSINDNEQAYLKILMDKVFGEEKFLKTLMYQTNNSVMKGTKDFRKDHEYILLYSSDFPFNKMPKNKLPFQNPDNDVKGPWINTNATYASNKKHKNYFAIKLPTGKKVFRKWRFSQKDYENKKIDLFIKDDNIPRIKIYEKDYQMKKTPSTIIDLNLPLSKSGMTTFTQAKNELFSILGEECFETSKPICLIKWLINRVNKKNAIVLDFFAGSGTTGHAVLDLNQEDGGNRQFILVTNNENNIGQNICYERLYRIIKGEGINGKKDFTWIKKNKSFVGSKLRVFNIEYKNVPIGTNIDELGSQALSEFKKLELNFIPIKNNIYYDLVSLLKNCK